MTIRVLHVIPALDYRGAAKQLTLLAGALPRDAFDVRVCALREGGHFQSRLQQDGVAVNVVGQRRTFDLKTLRRLKREIRDVAPDIVHTWQFEANCYGRWAVRRAGVRHFVAGQLGGEMHRSWTRGFLDRHFARRTARLVVESEAARTSCIGRGLPAEKFVVIDNGVETDDADAQTAPREEILDQLGLPHNARLIVAVCRLVQQNRVKDMIWAADLLKRARDDVHLLLVGDGPMRWRLKRYRDQVEIGDRVHFLGQRSDLLRLLPYCVCLWLTNQHGGCSNAILEAMAAGLPVVATNIAANRELVETGETGFLVPVADRAALAQWTNVLLGDPALATTMGRGGQQRVRDRHSVAQMVDRYAAMYRELVDGG